MFLMPALLVFSFTVVLPIIWSAVYSFHEWNGIGEMKFVGLNNYVKMFTGDKVFWRAFRNNLIYVAINIVIQLTFGVLLALLLTKLRIAMNFFKVMYFTPVVISSVAICQVFQKLMSYQPVGVINAALTAFGRSDLTKAWIADPDLALIIVSCIEGYRYIGLYMIILYSAFISIPQDVVEAAMLDGAHGWSMFSRIKFPLIKGVFTVTMVMVANGTMRGFDIPYLLTRGGPAYRSELMATYMYKNAFLTSQFGYGSAVAIFIAFESLLAVSFIRKIYS